MRVVARTKFLVDASAVLQSAMVSLYSCSSAYRLHDRSAFSVNGLLVGSTLFRGSLFQLRRFAPHKLQIDIDDIVQLRLCGTVPALRNSPRAGLADSR